MLLSLVVYKQPGDTIPNPERGLGFQRLFAPSIKRLSSHVISQPGGLKGLAGGEKRAFKNIPH
jgi:hypothetical protein